MIPQYNDDEEIYYASKTDEQPPSETYNLGERRCGWVKLIRDIVKFFHSVWVDTGLFSACVFCGKQVVRWGILFIIIN